MKPGDSAAEKELSQLHQSKSAFDSATNLLDTGDIKKALEYIDKVVLVFSPACSKVFISNNLRLLSLLQMKSYCIIVLTSCGKATWCYTEHDGFLMWISRPNSLRRNYCSQIKIIPVSYLKRDTYLKKMRIIWRLYCYEAVPTTIWLIMMSP